MAAEASVIEVGDCGEVGWVEGVQDENAGGVGITVVAVVDGVADSIAGFNGAAVEVQPFLIDPQFRLPGRTTPLAIVHLVNVACRVIQAALIRRAIFFLIVLVVIVKDLVVLRSLAGPATKGSTCGVTDNSFINSGLNHRFIIGTDPNPTSVGRCIAYLPERRLITVFATIALWCKGICIPHLAVGVVIQVDIFLAPRGTDVLGRMSLQEVISAIIVVKVDLIAVEVW